MNCFENPGKSVEKFRRKLITVLGNNHDKPQDACDKVLHNFIENYKKKQFAYPIDHALYNEADNLVQRSTKSTSIVSIMMHVEVYV